MLKNAFYFFLIPIILNIEAEKNNFSISSDTANFSSFSNVSPPVDALLSPTYFKNLRPAPNYSTFGPNHFRNFDYEKDPKFRFERQAQPPAGSPGDSADAEGDEDKSKDDELKWITYLLIFVVIILVILLLVAMIFLIYFVLKVKGDDGGETCKEIELQCCEECKEDPCCDPCDPCGC